MQHLYGMKSLVPSKLLDSFGFDRSWEMAKGAMCTEGPCDERCAGRLHDECWSLRDLGDDGKMVGVDAEAEESQVYNCVECAVKKGIVAHVASGPSACPVTYVQRQCTQWESVRRWTMARRKGSSEAGAAAKHYATRPEFKPKAGFKSVYSEMGACLLDKTELLIDIV